VKRWLSLTVVLALIGSVSLMASTPPLAAIEPTGTVVIQVSETTGSYATGLCLQPGELVLGAFQCSDASTQFVDFVAAGATVERTLAAGVYNAGVASLSPLALGGTGPVTVVGGQSITCTFSMTAAPACEPTPIPRGTVVIQIAESAGSFATGFCLQPGELVLGAFQCSDASTQFVDFVAAGATATRRLAPGTYNAGVGSLSPLALGVTGPVTVVAGEIINCTFSMTAAPACEGYDGNGDDIADADQAHVVTVAATGGPLVTIAAPSAAYPITDVTTPDMPEGTPPPAQLPLGIFGFTVTLPEGETTADVELVFPTGTNPTGYYKLRGGAWVDFTSNVIIDGDRVVLHLVDNDAFDTNPALGVIGDPGGPAVGFQFTGFADPLHDDVANEAKAGTTVPLKWRITDANGIGVSDPASFVSVTSVGGPCDATGTGATGTFSGRSGLQYLGDGYWQFNWKTPKAYKGHCREVRLNLADGVTGRVASFVFR
jgi:hypothetical protein